MRLSSVEPPRARASGLESPTLEPSATEPCRPIAPAAKRRASARLVLPAPPGPTSAIVLVPAALVGMFVSLRPCRTGPRGRRGRAPHGERSSLHLSGAKFKGAKARLVPADPHILPACSIPPPEGEGKVGVYGAGGCPRTPEPLTPTLSPWGRGIGSLALRVGSCYVTYARSYAAR